MTFYCLVTALRTFSYRSSSCSLSESSLGFDLFTFPPVSRYPCPAPFPLIRRLSYWGFTSFSSRHSPLPFYLLRLDLPKILPLACILSRLKLPSTSSVCKPPSFQKTFPVFSSLSVPPFFVPQQFHLRRKQNFSLSFGHSSQLVFVTRYGSVTHGPSPKVCSLEFVRRSTGSLFFRLSTSGVLLASSGLRDHLESYLSSRVTRLCPTLAGSTPSAKASSKVVKADRI